MGKDGIQPAPWFNTSLLNYELRVNIVAPVPFKTLKLAFEHYLQMCLICLPMYGRDSLIER